MKIIFKTRCLILLSLALASFVSNAQGTETLVRGKVFDGTTNEPLMGATIVAKNESTGSIAGTVTGMDGSFSLRELPIGGAYIFEVSYIGYSTIQYKGYQLKQGTNIDLGNVMLSQGEQLDEVVVLGRENNFTSRVDAGAALSISRQVLDLIPTASRDFKDLANFSPQASIPINNERYGISLAGVKSTSVGYTIDGANARRGVFGGTSTDAAFIISQEAVEEFRVETNNYNVVGPRNGGGAIKAITKRGTNDFSTSAWSYYTGNSLSQDEDFRGNQIGGEAGNSFDNWQAGFRVSGPIIKDKLTYFALYDRYAQNAPDGTSLLNYDLFTAQEQQGIEQSDVERLLNLLEDNSVIEDGSLAAQTGTFQKNDVTQNFFLRMDWDIDKVHKLTGRFSYLDFVGTYNAANVFVSHMIADRRFGWANKSFKGLLNLKSYFENGSFNDFKLNISTDNRFLTIPGEHFPSVSVGIGESGVAFGSPWWGGEEIYSTQYQLINDFNFTTDNGWNVTLGTDNIIHRSREFYPHFTASVIAYDNLDDLENDVSSSWTRLVPADGQPARRYYQYPLLEVSLYAQFSKYLTDDLKLDAGLRWDGYSISEKSQENPALDPLGIQTAQGISDFNNVQPRFNLTWDVNGENKDILKLGAGAFSSEPTTHAYTFALRGNGLDYRQITIDGNSSAAAQQLVGGSWKRRLSEQPSADQLDAAGANIFDVPTDIVTVADDFQTPMTWKANFTYLHNFNDWFSASISGYYANTIKQSYFEDINKTVRLDGSGAPELAADGRMQYVNSNPDFGSVLVFKNADWSATYLGLTAEATFRHKGGVLNLSYTTGDQKGESFYGAGSAWLQGQGIGRSYEDYSSQVGDWSSGYVINNKFVAILSSPSFHGFTVSGSLTTGQYERFSVVTGNDVNGIANEGGGDGRVRAGDLAFIFDPDDPNTPTDIAQDMQTLLANTSSEYRDALLENMGDFADQNTGRQPWQTITNLSVTKRFEFENVNISARMDVFNPQNLLSSDSGYNEVITNLNLYNIDGAGNIAINPNAGTKVNVFNPEALSRIQLGLKVQF
ncbi:carboxypeptidase regulatory-like domain-containing protein [Flagellimonas sp. 2504JD4-2]